MASCNGCTVARLRVEHKEYLIKVTDPDGGGGVSYFIPGDPSPGQSTRTINGAYVQFKGWFMSDDHSYDRDCQLSHKEKEEHWIRARVCKTLLGLIELAGLRGKRGRAADEQLIKEAGRLVETIKSRYNVKDNDIKYV